jgi:starch phosphorylase
MVEEYADLCYMPSHRRFMKLSADQFREAAQLAQWRRRVADHWNQVRVESVEAPPTDPLHVGAELGVKVRLNLGSINPEDVEVQLVHGAMDSMDQISHPQTARLHLTGSPEPSANGHRVALYSGSIPCRTSGHFGYCVRVLPKHASLPHPFEPGLVTWG